MAISLMHQIKGVDHVDEFWIGESEANKPGRSYGKKKR